MGGMMGPPPQRTEIGYFQVTMVLDRGTITGGTEFSPQRSRPNDEGWHLLTIPVRNMSATPGATGSVRRVIITTDKEDTWYLGQAALAVDAPAIAVSLRQPTDTPGAQVAEVTVAPGPVTLVADVEAGASDVAVEWNFDADNAGAPAVAATFPGAPGGYPGGYPGGSSSSSSSSSSSVGEPGAFPPGAAGAPGFPGAPGFGGARVDARGLVGKFEYPNEEQNYRVEVTVRDRSGKKKPVTSSILVKVRG